ncbi:unnamed protein product [Lampetra planeri]
MNYARLDGAVAEAPVHDRGSCKFKSQMERWRWGHGNCSALTSVVPPRFDRTAPPPSNKKQRQWKPSGVALSAPCDGKRPGPDI